jgi:hypothetical protein
MSTTTAGPAADPHDPRPKPGTEFDPVRALYRVGKALASLQLTVVLFGFGILLVFFGTVAMMATGLWTAVDHYFRAFVVWVPFDVFRLFGTVFFDLPKDGAKWGGSFPFPAGWTIGIALAINLLAAHLVRFKLAWNRAGIIILHAGMIVLLVGELITGVFAVESTMTISTGETTDFVDVTREYEIAVTDRTSDPKEDRVVVVPHRLVRTPGTVADDRLPFDIEVVEYWANTAFDESDKPFDGEHVRQVRGHWLRFRPIPEGVGVDTEARADIPSATVVIREKGTGKELARDFVSLWFYPNMERNRRMIDVPPLTVAVKGVPYEVMLRNKRVYKPYSVRLVKFEHGKYPGTDIPKDFASTVLVTDKETGDSREVRIWMNNPLRYQGDSLFQFAVMGEDTGTVLQVVRNPGRLLPYIACFMVTVGMMIHFGMRLSRFQQKRRAAA